MHYGIKLQVWGLSLVSFIERKVLLLLISSLISLALSLTHGSPQPLLVPLLTQFIPVSVLVLLPMLLFRLICGLSNGGIIVLSGTQAATKLLLAKRKFSRVLFLKRSQEKSPLLLYLVTVALLMIAITCYLVVLISLLDCGTSSKEYCSTLLQFMVGGQ
ncbi:PREDICTED: uncharacterized protein LOC109588387 isoform X1 [Amphimedon queenslandica]|uniref:Uncharacterized protein n=1 Tax=Amphimedon queenslandica TaxID=400682 RepID=A0AAN0JSN0_AMPQE|nr:PREDICTED: uncharacterized protein LOC109588387 isoform X1 [Amphimedon queenslandica]|eukprot:XP_019860118.1 PREDICTED: uncharacterized protein LOC109588387 isoform X1 [Amphimedon queenslandica]